MHAPQKPYILRFAKSSSQKITDRTKRNFTIVTGERYEAAAQEVLAGASKIAVNFNTIEASPAAIIVRGEDDGSFNAIRARLVEELPLPPDTKQPPQYYP